VEWHWHQTEAECWRKCGPRSPQFYVCGRMVEELAALQRLNER